LNLASLVENLPSGERLLYIADMNNRGDLLGYGDQHPFLLKRVGEAKQ